MTSLEIQDQVQQRQIENIMREIEELIPFFDDVNILNIFILASGRIKLEHFTAGVISTDIYFKKEKVLRIIHFIAASSEKSIDEKGIPTLEAIIPQYRFRLTAVIQPWVEIPQLTIRRPNPKIIPLKQWIDDGRISQAHYNLITQYIKERKNIAIGGATNSGKTTFLNSCMDAMVDFFPDERYLIIEETPELKCRAEDCTHLHIKKTQALESVEFAMRWSMKHLIFGEVRTSAVFNALFEAWQTGHPGNLTTFHAETAVSMVTRMRWWLEEEEFRLNIPKTIHLCVHLTNKKVDEVLPTELAETLNQTVEQMEAHLSQYRNFHELSEKLTSMGKNQGDHMQ